MSTILRSGFISAIMLLTMSIPINAQAATVDLHYLVRQPTVTSAKPPVLILLHGVGSNEQDLFTFADRIPGEYLVLSLRAPNTLGQGSYAWYQVDFSTGRPVFNKEQEERSRATLIRFIEQLGTTHSIDAQRVYLCGFSQGAIMAYSVALTRPELVHGISAMSGRLLEEVKPRISRTPQLQKLSVLITHGTQDTTLPVRYAEEAEAYLSALGVTPALKTYPEGHTISAAMLADLLAWLD
ncbi:MAG TPA: PHB depolymerase family esterase [Flavobacteriales bacterium]|jgi:phospholipase/carboxylesterase|nr:dienelactone hydrolase family protein [Flavobacteriales bacterium]HMU13324.1 PHB depolymerase family esterase [Flavobacteriales bacterium]